MWGVRGGGRQGWSKGSGQAGRGLALKQWNGWEGEG